MIAPRHDQHDLKSIVDGDDSRCMQARPLVVGLALEVEDFRPGIVEVSDIALRSEFHQVVIGQVTIFSCLASSERNGGA